jgi:hypothetical protein
MTAHAKNNIALHGCDDVQCASSYLNSSKRKTMLNRNILTYTIAALGLLCQSNGAAPDEYQFTLYHRGSDWGNGTMRVSTEPIRYGLSTTAGTLLGQSKQLSEMEEDHRVQHEEWSATLKSLIEKVGTDDRAAVIAAYNELQKIRGRGVERRDQTMRMLNTSEGARLAASDEPNGRLRRAVDYLKEELMNERRQREAVIRSRICLIARTIECYVGGSRSKIRPTEEYMAKFEAREKKARMDAAQDLAG